jgi:hypothetical protein
MGYGKTIYSIYVESRIMNFHQELTEIWPFYMDFTISTIINQACNRKILFLT